MAILAFQKPDKVLMLEADNTFGKFEFKPLEPGYGITIGNALRRILLSSLEGYAIASIKIDGVKHEFKRIRAHRALNRIVQAGCMSKDGVYFWLSGRLNLPYEETHIGYFSDYLCEQTIKECEQVWLNWKERQIRYAA